MFLPGDLIIANTYFNDYINHNLQKKRTAVFMKTKLNALERLKANHNKKLPLN